MSLTKCPHCSDQHACHSGDSHAATVATENILFYIGFWIGTTVKPGAEVRLEDVQVPASAIIALIQGDKTLDELTRDIGQAK